MQTRDLLLSLSKPSISEVDYNKLYLPGQEINLIYKITLFIILRAANLLTELLESKKIYKTLTVGSKSLFDRFYSSDKALQASIATISLERWHYFSRNSIKF